MHLSIMLEASALSGAIIFMDQQPCLLLIKLKLNQITENMPWDYRVTK